MVKGEVKVLNPNGFHARPTTALVKTAMGFQSEITIVAAGERISAKDLFALMDAPVACGDVVVVECVGADEGNALKTMVRAIEEGLGE